MKRIMTLLIVLTAVAVVPTIKANAQTQPKNGESHTHEGTWKKAKNNSWPGVVNEQVYRYKMDKGARLLWSPDGKKWEADSDGMWTDKEGNFYKIEGQNLVWSPDAGNTWSDTPEWKWEGADGNWYKLDKDWTVWMSRK